MEDETTYSYSWECPESRRRSNSVAAALVAMAALLATNFVLVSAGVRFGFTWPVAGQDVFVPWLAVVAAAVPVVIAIAMKAAHFVAVVVMAVLLLVVVPALVSGYLV